MSRSLNILFQDGRLDPINIAKYERNKRKRKTPKWKIEILDNILGHLTERERDSYKLVRGEGFTFTEAAQFMGCTKGTIQSFVRRAEKKTKRFIHDTELDYEPSGSFILARANKNWG